MTTTPTHPQSINTNVIILPIVFEDYTYGNLVDTRLIMEIVFNIYSEWNYRLDNLPEVLKESKALYSVIDEILHQYNLERFLVGLEEPNREIFEYKLKQVILAKVLELVELERFGFKPYFTRGVFVKRVVFRGVLIVLDSE